MGRKNKQVLCSFDVKTKEERAKLKNALEKKCKSLKARGIRTGVGPVSRALLYAYLDGFVDDAVFTRMIKKCTRK